MTLWNDKPDVAVCLCTYRRPALLRRCLKSLAAQAASGRFEIVVVANDAQASGRAVTGRSEWPLAPSIATPMGTPDASVRTLRLTPSLARSVRLGPVCFPAERDRGDRAVHRLPGPVDPVQLVVVLEAHLPEVRKDPRRRRLLKPGVGGTHCVLENFACEFYTS